MAQGKKRGALLLLSAVFWATIAAANQPPGSRPDMENLQPDDNYRPMLIKDSIETGYHIQNRPFSKHIPIEYNYVPDGSGKSFFRLGSVQIALPMIAAGSLLITNDIGFRDLPNELLGPSWRYRYDDYLQYAPATVLLGLKAFGVEGRSSWGRMITSAAFSTVATVTMVNGLKLIGIRQRPDGSNMRSFPSGHTATAFMTATLLHKEYGTTVSPWFSVGGYAVASGIGISRMLNNKHWLSDVIAGAGFGILSAELGYLITDAIFKDKGLLRPTSELMPVDNSGCPSFVSLMMGAHLGPVSTTANGKVIEPGVKFGIQGAWFITPRWGIGGRTEADRYSNIAAKDIIKELAGNESLTVPKYNSLSVQIGAYRARTIGRRWLAMGYVMCGVAVPILEDFSFSYESASEGNISVNLDFPRKPYLNFTTGASISWLASNHLGIRLFTELKYVRYAGTETLVIVNSGKTGSRDFRHHRLPFAAGIAFDAMLW